MPLQTDELKALERSWAVLLTTFKRDGTPVGTAVNLAVGGNRAYFKTYAKAWKARRLARDPRVELAPSNVRGTPRGPTLPGTARLLEGDEVTPARRALARRHPIFQRLFIPLVHRLARYQTLYYEVTTAY
jgi:hypothetical protein